jgi:hypothetical protein
MHDIESTRGEKFVGCAIYIPYWEADATRWLRGSGASRAQGGLEC